MGLAECQPPGQNSVSPPAFWSRWALEKSFLPRFEEDPDDYARKVLELVRRWQPTVVVASSDQSIASLRPWRSRIERHTSLALASEDALAIAVDKEKTLELAADLGIHGPRTVAIQDVKDVPAAMAITGYPAVVKPTASWFRDCRGARLLAVAVINQEEALNAVGAFQRQGVRVLVQEWSGGAREAVSLFRVHGQILAEFAQVALRTTPVLGGASVVRQSIPMPEDLRAAAVSLVHAMDLDGYAEVEFRRDSHGRPLIMEVDPRLSGSVELALRCGVDFSRMLWQWGSGRPVEGATSYKTGHRHRWLAGDCSWLVETLKNPGRPDTLSVPRTLLTFLGDFARPASYDHLDSRDLLPAVAEVGRLVTRAATTGSKRSRVAAYDQLQADPRRVLASKGADCGNN